MTRCTLWLRRISSIGANRASLLYNTTPFDPVTLGSVSLLLSSVALLASYIPARRAAGADPMVFLRYGVTGAKLGAAGDLPRTEQWIRRVGLNQHQADELILAASKAAAKMMTENIATIRKIANVLEQKKRIAKDEIREIMRQDGPGNILAL
jgi:hypothetical protein